MPGVLDPRSDVAPPSKHSQEENADPGYAAFLLEQIQAPGGHDAGKGCCQACSTPLHQLKQEALQTIHSPVQPSYSAAMPALSTGSFLRQPSRITISSSASEGKPPARAAQAQSRPALPPGGERQRGLPWPQVSSSSSSSVTPLPSGPQTSVQVTVGGGGQLTGTVGSVTVQAQQYLEGVWSISPVNHFLLPQPGPGVSAARPPQSPSHALAERDERRGAGPLALLM
ncbi:unnamed protein product [Boreogadus saida]